PPTPAATPSSTPAPSPSMTMPMPTTSSAAAAPRTSAPPARTSSKPSSPPAPPPSSSRPAPPPSSSNPPPQNAVITISGFAFSGPLTVAPGQLITVHNADSAGHTVTADNGAFDVPVAGGATVTFHAPTTPGKYTYHCAVHPIM